MPSLPELLELAERAALRGGRIVLAGRSGASEERKGAGDYVTEVDRASERAIREVLGAGPDIPVVGEEGGGEPGERYWVVDPLDGTTNYLHGFPVVGVSVALAVSDRPPDRAVVGTGFPFRQKEAVAAGVCEGFRDYLSGDVLAGSPPVHAELLSIVAGGGRRDA